MRIALFSCGAVLLLTCEAFAISIVETKVSPINGHTYHLLSQSNWTDAEAFAVTLGGHLATVRSQAEEDWIWNTFQGLNGVYPYLWIGLTDYPNLGDFYWTSGEPLGYFNWMSSDGQPSYWDNFHPDGVPEYYVQMGYGLPEPIWKSKWNDLVNVSTWGGNPVQGVVEIVPEPSGLVLGIAGIVVIAFAIRRGQR